MYVGFMFSYDLFLYIDLCCASRGVLSNIFKLEKRFTFSSTGTSSEAKTLFTVIVPADTYPLYQSAVWPIDGGGPHSTVLPMVVG